MEFKMKSLLIILLIFLPVNAFSQSFKVVKVKGSVQGQVGTSEKWIEIRVGNTLDANTMLSTNDNSSVQLVANDLKFNLRESSAISTSAIKQMSVDELLLALALDDIMQAPKKNNDSDTKNTAVYGTNLNGNNGVFIKSNDFGIKRLNGAVQLAQVGLRESAVATAREIYRKYPEVKGITAYRLFFGQILVDLGLYQEAFEEYKSIQSLKLSTKEKEQVEENLEMLSKKIISEEK
jgi:hypothetical protein